MKKNTRIGFVGLGIMGMAMAHNVQKKGYTVLATTRSPEKRKAGHDIGLKILETPAAVAQKSDVVVIMVTDPAAVWNVINGADGLLSIEGKGKTLLQMSTLDEPSTLAIGKAVQEKGWDFIDAPVMGSKIQVEAAQLIILAGGDIETIEKWKPLFLMMGKTVIFAGPTGKGTCLKLCMNLIVAQMTSALCEAVALARVQDVNPTKIFEAIQASPAIKCGYFDIKEKTILNEDFAPAFSLANMLKDVRFMDQTAKDKKLLLPVTQAVRYLMESALADGLGNEDLASIVKVLKPKKALT